jgi:hypothetical protein
MEVDVQFHVSTALSPGRGSPVRVEQEAGWAPELIFCPCRKSVHDSSVIEGIAKQLYRVHCPGFVVN